MYGQGAKPLKDSEYRHSPTLALEVSRPTDPPIREWMSQTPPISVTPRPPDPPIREWMSQTPPIRVTPRPPDPPIREWMSPPPHQCHQGRRHTFLAGGDAHFSGLFRVGSVEWHVFLWH